MRFASTKTFLKVLITLILAGSFLFLLKEDFLKVRSVLGANPLWQSLKDQREKVMNKAMIVTINHYRPDLAVWKNFFLLNAVPGKKFLADSTMYYEAIIDYAPQMAQAHHMLAVCQYLLGETQAALVSEQKAALLEPRFFGAWYNLGVMYYKEGQFAQSAQSFRQALNLAPVATVKVIESSRIFSEIIRSTEIVDIVNAQGIQNGYRDAGRLLEASLRRLRGQPAGINDNDVVVKIF